tara:strand:- start:708 stop:1301 length:594 start_codon:yes stop_codon:yes gene_type:complete
MYSNDGYEDEFYGNVPDSGGYEDEFYGSYGSDKVNQPSFFSLPDVSDSQIERMIGNQSDTEGEIFFGGDDDEDDSTWQESVRKFLGIGETGAKFFAGMAGGKTPPRKPPKTQRASSRGRDARTDPISRAREARSRQVASLRRPPVEVDFDKLINGNVLTKVKGAMEEYIQNPTGPKGTKIALSSAGLGAIRSTKKLT